ncbi:MAG: sigma-70 family RNA polymerase sigma factor [Bdellovibrionales bacterium]|nr:sigma-70 family RNA polymerase sigma factor [Bdellovibrionales bacterium]
MSVATAVDEGSQRSETTKGRILKFRSKKKADGLSEYERQELIIEFRVKARKLGRSILRKWHSRMDLQEVDSIVDLSLCEAVRRFDPSKGASFMTFLYYHLKGNLIRAVSSAANANVIPGSENDPNEYEGEEVKSITALDVVEALSGTDQRLPDEVLLKKELIRLSQDACGRLDPLEREVIQRIYLEGQQLMDIASSLGYSRCHISRVKKKALETLQDDITHYLELHADKKDEDVTDLEFERKQIHRRRPRSKKAKEVREERSLKVA